MLPIKGTRIARLLPHANLRQVHLLAVKHVPPLFRELERIARRLKEEEERRAKETGGVRFKGRGRMKYLDPELQRDRS